MHKTSDSLGGLSDRGNPAGGSGDLPAAPGGAGLRRARPPETPCGGASPEEAGAIGAPRDTVRGAEDPLSNDCLVRYRAVSKTFDGAKHAVDNLNLEIRRGEFLTMLGPSGSGKTTSLMMLAGFEEPSRGDILIDGCSMRGVAPHRRNLGMVFQNYALFPHLTVAENLAFPLQARRLSKAATGEKVARALDLVQLAGLGARRPAQLSGGQQQRIAVARALIYEPSLVLMDEPLGALDKQLREQMQLELKRMHERLGVTFVYVTHDQTEALTISDRIAVFDRGQVQQVAHPTRLYEAPDTVFVAKFLGETNILPGYWREGSRLLCRIELEGGETVLASPAAPPQSGAPVAVCLRPESVALGPYQEDAVNQFRAEILERIYLGDHLRLRLRVCRRDDFLVKLPRHAEAAAYHVGQSCFVRWQPRDCRALAADTPRAQLT